MKNEVNLRLKDWFRAMKKSKILTTQKELGEIVRNRDGGTMSQAFVSSMMNGESAVSEHTIAGICDHYFFTKPEFFISGTVEMVLLHELMQYILKKHGKSQKWLVSQLKDPDFTESTLSLMDNRTDAQKWEKVFSRLNRLGYNVNPIYLTTQHAGDTGEFKGKSKQVERLFEAIDFLMYQRKISSKREFCDIINEHSEGDFRVYEQTLSNMASTRYKQDVTKDMAVSFLKAFREISPDWFLLGSGPMLRDASSSYTIMMRLENELKKISDKLEESDN